MPKTEAAPNARLLRSANRSSLRRLFFRVLVLMRVGVMHRMMLGGLVAVMRRVQAVGMRQVGVVTRLGVIALLVVLGGFAVMLGGFLVVLRGGLVMDATLVPLGHVVLLVRRKSA